MIHRIDAFTENSINPITGLEYDSSWIIFQLTDSEEYQMFVGSQNGCAYSIKVSRKKCTDWKMSVCDFIGFCEANEKNALLILSAEDLAEAKHHYRGHSFRDTLLREYEPTVLVHSTPWHNWEQIQQDGMLKSWNILKSENVITEEFPIGRQLGDPLDFSDYIMFGGGITGEIVVNSKQQGRIVMDTDSEYLTGARLYFDATKIAKDGLLIRDGCHLKVKDTLPLSPYLIWSATWNRIGLASRISTPKTFAELSDNLFQQYTGCKL